VGVLREVTCLHAADQGSLTFQEDVEHHQMPVDEAQQLHESIAERELFDGPAIQDSPDVLQHLVHLL
jgi:hypothetical protein